MDVGGKSLSLNVQRRHIYPVREESGTLVTQLSEPPNSLDMLYKKYIGCYLRK